MIDQRRSLHSYSVSSPPFIAAALKLCRLSWTVKFLLVELIVMLTAATSGVTVVVAEKELSEHEAAAGTSILAYALAKQLVSLPLISLQPFFFLLAYIQGGEPYARWEMQFALLFVLAFAGSGLGNLVGVFAKKSPYLLVCIISIFVGVFNSYSPQFETLQAIGMSEAGARALLSWSPLRWCAPRQSETALALCIFSNDGAGTMSLSYPH